MIAEALTTTNVVAEVIPDVTPELPPGIEPVLTVLNWLAGGVILLGVAGFLTALGFLAFAAYTGREITGFKGIFIACFVCILAASVTVILRAVL